MLDALKRLIADGLLLTEVQRLCTAVERIATALEAQNAHQWPQQILSVEAPLETEVTYVDQAQQAALMEIEMRLTAARGTLPTDDEVYAEYERLQAGQ